MHGRYATAKQPPPALTNAGISQCPAAMQETFQQRGLGHPAGHTLANKTLGIVGMGAIGKRLAQMATGLGMEVTAKSHHQQCFCTLRPSLMQCEVVCSAERLGAMWSALLTSSEVIHQPKGSGCIVAMDLQMTAVHPAGHWLDVHQH